MRAEVLECTAEGNRIMQFSFDSTRENFFSLLDRVGQMPLPPYITEKLQDKDRYQTVYARERGSAAAPTAGLHFTKELLRRIEEKGVKIAKVMLHVGLGTFRPVKVDKVEAHVMHSEYFSVTPEAAQIVNNAKSAGGRIICVGTTSCRTLESACDEEGILHPMSDNHLHFHLSRIPFQGDRCPDYQLSPSRKHPAHAGLRSGGQRLCAPCL